MIESIEVGRKEDGNRSIADKIIKRLHDLFKTVENNQGRWAWELLQNAKDSIAECEDRTVSIQLILDHDSVTFSHNGAHFTERDVRGLINQISSKEAEEGQHTKTTGRFGTGFLTTHLLSLVVDVKGILETNDNEFYAFAFTLNREGKTTAQLIPKIENAWSEFHRSASVIDANYNRGAFNTSFGYRLSSNEQKRIAQIGIQEFINLMPFVLVFIPKIESVEIIDHVSNKKVNFQNSQDLVDDNIVCIRRTENQTSEDIPIVYLGNKRLAIAALAEKTETGYSYCSTRKIPKLFCDFPLIGTETFYFPVIVNSFYFNPQIERDGIWLKDKQEEDIEVRENQGLMEEAVKLFQDLIERTSENSFFNFFNIADTRLPITNERYFDEGWYKAKIQKPLRETVFTAKIVELEAHKLELKAPRDLWFPAKTYLEKVRVGLWQFTYDLFSEAVCKSDHLHEWCSLSWEAWAKLDYAELISDIEKQIDLEKLGETLNKDNDETIEWLNQVGEFILEEETNLALFERGKFLPNKKGKFKKKGELFIDNIEDEILVEILRLLGKDWDEILLHQSIEFGKYYIKEKKDIASEITSILKNSLKNDLNHIKAISLLSEWFETYPEWGKEFFSELYRKRAELFMNTIEDRESLYRVMRSKTGLSKLSEVVEVLDSNPQILESVNMTGELFGLLAEFKAASAAELRTMLLNAQGNNVSAKLDLTPEILANLGVTSIKELEEVFKDQNLASVFVHTSNPTFKSFTRSQALIKRAKENVVAHLKTLPEYELDDEAEDLSFTVVGGFKKNNIPIRIVIRPSDAGFIIVYYPAEKNTLDYDDAELWVDNGIEKPRRISLGRVLKNIGINKIPV